MSTVPRIDNEDERLSRRRRRHFTIEEYRILYRTARKRISEINNNAGLTLQREQRKLLHDYIMILANTGLRVDEAGTLIWRNVNFDEHTLLLERAGKTKSTRRVYMRAGAVRALRRIRARRNAYLAERGELIG